MRVSAWRGCRRRRAARPRLLRGRRVDTHGGVEVRLGGAALEGHREALHHLGRVRPHQVDANDLVAGGVHNQLHEELLVTP